MKMKGITDEKNRYLACSALSEEYKF